MTFAALGKRHRPGFIRQIAYSQQDLLNAIPARYNLCGVGELLGGSRETVTLISGRGRIIQVASRDPIN